jgi:hypothetical protein
MDYLACLSSAPDYLVVDIQDGAWVFAPDEPPLVMDLDDWLERDVSGLVLFPRVIH